MADRPRKLARRQITEESIEESQSESGSENVEPPSSGTIRVGDNQDATNQSTVSMSRPRRTAAQVMPDHASPSVTVSRSPSGSPEDRRKSIRLTVKMPASKLREVTIGFSAPSTRGGGRELPRLVENKHVIERALQVRSSTRSKEVKRYAEWGEDDDEDDEDEDLEDDVDADMNAATGEAEEEEEDADGEPDDDAEMEDAPVAPPLGSYSAPKVETKATPKPRPKPTSQQPAKLSFIVTPAPTAQIKSVEEKEMELDDQDGDEDEELSELESDADEEEEQDETGLGAEDVEGEEEDIEEDEDAEGEDDDPAGEGAGSDEEAGSGTSTPDYAKMTKRQRGQMQDEGQFLALPMEPQVKKILTADEHRMRRAEMARRRKNLSEKRNEEEKMTTINKLLKRQATKKRGKAPDPATVAAASAAEGATLGSSDEEVVEKANPYFVTWVSDRNGVRLGVPQEWLEKKVGRVFGGPPHNGGRRLVEEVED